MNLLRNFLILIAFIAATLGNAANSAVARIAHIDADFGGKLKIESLHAATNEALLPELIKFVESQGYTPGTEDYKAALKLGSLLVGTVTGAATGGSQGANAAGNTALDATTNNYLNHTQWKQLGDKLSTCKTETECSQVRKEFLELNAKQDQQMAQSCQDLASPACKAHIALALEGTQTQLQLAAAGNLPSEFLAGSDYNKNANLTAKNLLMNNFRVQCSLDPSCTAKSDKALESLASVALDFIPIIGDVKAFMEAKSPFDYLMATVGTITGPIGDGAKLLIKEAKVAAEAGNLTKAAEKLNDAKAQLHHICTDKNCVSTANGGPWTPRFDDMFSKAGMNLQDDLNKVLVVGHKGPHPEAYHSTVFNQLQKATEPFVSNPDAYRQALQAELAKISKKIATPGTVLNKLVTKKP